MYHWTAIFAQNAQCFAPVFLVAAAPAYKHSEPASFVQCFFRVLVLGTLLLHLRCQVNFSAVPPLPLVAFRKEALLSRHEKSSSFLAACLLSLWRFSLSLSEVSSFSLSVFRSFGHFFSLPLLRLS